MNPKYEAISLTTTSGGAATVRSETYFRGRLSYIEYVKDDFDDGSVILITGDKSGQILWTETGVNASEIIAPRRPTHDNAGAASLYEAGEAVLDHYVLADERIKIVITGGGNAKNATFKVVVY